MAAVRTPFTVSMMARDGVVEVAVIGELDIATAPELGRALGDIDEPERVIVVDLRETEFLDCAGVRVLSSVHASQRKLGGDVILDSPTQAVSRVLELTGIDQEITVLR